MCVFFYTHHVTGVQFHVMNGDKVTTVKDDKNERDEKSEWIYFLGCHFLRRINDIGDLSCFAIHISVE